ncbi:MAG: BBP7 family outer membrane beta-barrel protein [Planctomycetota bacterium]
MNTDIIFRETAGSCGQDGHLPRIRFRTVCRLTAIGLWFALAVVASGMVFSSTATAQDASWQEQPRRRARTIAPRYPDEELPSRSVALNDDMPSLTTPVPPDAVDSPSNRPEMKRKAKPSGEEIRDDEPRPARGTHPTPRHPVVVDEENALEPRDPFGNRSEECDGNQFGYSGLGVRGILRDRLWFRGEALLWWLRGGQTPPLLTTSSGTTSQAEAGVLPGATVLFGDQELNTGLHAGSRLTFGLWLDSCEESGLEFSYLILGENRQAYNNASDGVPILARPYFNVSGGSETSILIAYPNFSSGTFSATSTENFQGAEALWRRAVVHGCNGRIDFLAGYRFLRLTDGLEIASVQDSAIQPGAKVGIADTFHTRNDFNGADVGFATQWHRNRWSLDTLLKLGIGQTNTQVLINGSTTVNNGTPLSGGLLALPSNMGSHESRQFSVIPEIGLTLGYDLTSRLKATVGYTLLYWSNVARPGDQIDLNVDPNQFPTQLVPVGTGTKPAFVLHTSDFWAQGLNLGLDYRF